MPFGLCNAPVTFQCVMQSLLRGFGDFCYVYIDDVIIFSWIIKEHQKHLAMVLQRLGEHHLKLHSSNTAFTQALWQGSVQFGMVRHDYSVLYEHVPCRPGLYLARFLLLCCMVQHGLLLSCGGLNLITPIRMCHKMMSGTTWTKDKTF